LPPECGANPDIVVLQVRTGVVDTAQVGWIRTDVQDPDTAEVTAWLRTVIAWIGETCLLVGVDVTVAGPGVVVVPEGEATVNEAAEARPAAPLRLVAVESAA